MESTLKGNDLDAAVPKFCLLLEEDRRTPEGRIRSSKQFREHYFPYDDRASTDRAFKYMPNEVRGPILAAWGIRGPKSALKDDDAKIQAVVHDALIAGDLDDYFFEEGLVPSVAIRWSDLADWWTFWRTGPLTKHAIRHALETAYTLGLFNARWFLDTIESRGGKLRGTDVLADVLSKQDLTDWIRNIHQSGDGSPKGLIAALGWEKIVAKTADDVLIAVIDAVAQKNGLSPKKEAAKEQPKEAAKEASAKDVEGAPARAARSEEASDEMEAALQGIALLEDGAG